MDPRSTDETWRPREDTGLHAVSPISSPPRASHRSLWDKRWPGVSVGLGSASGLSRVEGFVTRVGSLWGTSAGSKAPMPPARPALCWGLGLQTHSSGQGRQKLGRTFCPREGKTEPCC